MKTSELQRFENLKLKEFEILKSINPNKSMIHGFRLKVLNEYKQLLTSDIVKGSFATFDDIKRVLPRLYRIITNF